MTRRDCIGVVSGGAVAFGKASQPSTRIGFRVPAGTCDCHTHIFGDPKRFPLFAGRAYTPEIALPAEMRKLHRALHVDRVVIVQPSVYGTDNAATLFGMKEMGAKRARGIAVIGPQTSERELLEMDRAGIRGVRLNNPAVNREMFEYAVNRLKSLRHWHIQIFTRLVAVQALKPLILDSPLPVVIDHVAGALPEQGANQQGFGDLVELVRAGKAYVKITHNFMSLSRATMFEDAEVLGKALLAANPSRILWGTDWPHPNSASGRKPHEISPLNQIDDGRLLNHFASWMQTNATRVLVENPATLYEFV